MGTRYYSIFLIYYLIQYSSLNAQCGMEFDANGVAPIGAGLYQIEFEFQCDTTIEIQSVDYRIWGNHPPFQNDSIYQEGDKITWGTSLMDTLGYRCLQPLPYPGIHPNDSLGIIFWEAIETVPYIDPNASAGQLEETIIQYPNFIYNYESIFKSYIVRPYGIDSSNTIHFFHLENSGYLIPGYGEQLNIIPSHYNWNFSEDPNLFIPPLCITDTIEINVHVADYYGFSIEDAKVALTATGVSSILEPLVYTNNDGISTFNLNYNIDMLVPEESENCNEYNCDSCTYSSFISSITVTLMEIPIQTQSINFELSRNTGECGICPGYEFGCTDETAWNFDPNIGFDDGSCLVSGDINADLRLNIFDLIYLAELVYFSNSMTEFESFSGDVNQDSVIDSGDISALIDLIMGVE